MVSRLISDIELWHTLISDCSREDLQAHPLVTRAALVGISTLPLEQRVPFLDLVLRLADHPSAEVRVAVLRVLIGSSGWRVRQHVIAALDDPELTVRETAIDVIMRCPANVALVAHAAFHPREEIRTATIGRIFNKTERAASEIVRNLPIYLLTDPALRDQVMAKIQSDPLGGLSPFIIYQFHRQTLIDSDMARSLILHTAPFDLEGVLADDLSKAGNHASPFLQWLIACFWPSSNSQGVAEDELTSELYPNGIFGFLIDQLHSGRCPGLDFHLFRPCYEIAKSTQRWSHRAIEALLFADRNFLNDVLTPEITRPMLRRALRIFYRMGREAPELPAPEFARAITGCICRDESSKLDLWIVGAFMHRRRKDGFELLLKRHDIATLVTAFWENPDESVFLFAHSEPSKQRDSLLIAIQDANPNHPTILALLLLTLPADDELGLVIGTKAESLEVLRSLERLTHHQEWRPSNKRCQFVAQQIAAKWCGDKTLDKRTLREFLDGWIGQRWSHLQSIVESRPQATESETQNLYGALPEPSRAKDTRKLIAEVTRFTIGADLLTIIAQSMHSDALVQILNHSVSLATLENLVEVFSYIPGLPYAFEQKLAQAVVGHENPVVRSWATDRLASAVPSMPGLQRDDRSINDVRNGQPVEAEPLSDEEVKRIQTVLPHLLSDALQPARQNRRTRVVEALHLRPEPSLREESVAACVALLSCADSKNAVLAAIDRFLQEDESLCDEVTGLLLPVADARAVDSIGCIWLYRWEKYAFQFGENELHDAKAVYEWLQFAIEMPSKLLGTIVFDGIARVLAIWTARDRPKAEKLYDAELTSLLIDQLVGPYAETAAWMLVRAAKAQFANVAQEATKKQITSMVPALIEPVRQVLAQWIDIDAFGTIKVVARTPIWEARTELAAKPLDSHDLEALSTSLTSSRTSVVMDAINLLLQHGQAGIARLLQALATKPLLARASIIADSVKGWPREFFWSVFEKIQSNQSIDDWLKFLVAINLIEAIDADADSENPGTTPEAVSDELFRGVVYDWLNALLLQPCSESWFQAMDRDRWWAIVREADHDSLQMRMVFSPHPFLYVQAVNYLLDRLNRSDELADQDASRMHEQLVAFLKLGADRDRKLRARVAESLHRRGDPIGYPLILSAAVTAGLADGQEFSLSALSGPWVGVAVKSLLCAGEATVPEAIVLQLLKRNSHDQATQDAIHSVLAEAVSESVRRSAAEQLRGDIGRANKLRRVAEAFRRGVSIGRELTGRLFTIEMIGGSEFGYTRLTENRIYINPMPLLSNVPNADDIVEGLILHELGHHLYHRGSEAAEVWERASTEGLGKLLNLVADEHLERNLRAISKQYGVQLKRLGVYAFNRSAKDYSLETLLSLLGGRAFAVLVENPPAVARDPAAMRVRGGSVLLALDQAGHSFSRFFRALRLGLGERTGDPKVSAALELFGKKFRHSSMEELYNVTLKLREIFGDDATMLHWLCSDSLLVDDEGDLIWQGDGITNAEIQREVERITKAPRSRGATESGRLCINVGSDEDFDKISLIDRLPFQAEAYQEYVPPVAGCARQLRRFFQDLGIAQVPVYRRTRGRLLDRSRLQSLVIRRDPRVLISREFSRRNDLFLAVAVDCSGSMQVDDNIEKAKMFAALMAESCRGLGGVDLKLFGFRHDVIHDAGNAERPAIAGLEAGGGNNDAAALWYASQLAFASSRKSKVLVMISDGLPTECTTTALKSLVTRLSRRGVCCAQVAVRPISEVCFPHYVELSESDLPSAVRRFGGIVAKLVESTFKS